MTPLVCGGGLCFRLSFLCERRMYKMDTDEETEVNAQTDGMINASLGLSGPKNAVKMPYPWTCFHPAFLLAHILPLPQAGMTGNTSSSLLDVAWKEKKRPPTPSCRRPQCSSHKPASVAQYEILEMMTNLTQVSSLLSTLVLPLHQLCPDLCLSRCVWKSSPIRHHCQHKNLASPRLLAFNMYGLS